MNEQEFYQEIANRMEAALKLEGRIGAVYLEEIVKCNDQKEAVLCIESSIGSMKQRIHLGYSYEQLQAGHSIEEIMEALVDQYKNHERVMETISIEDFEYKEMREKLSIMIVDPKENREWLRDKITEPCGPFTKVYFFRMKMNDVQTGTVYPTKAYCAAKKVSEDRLKADAEERHSQEPATLYEMENLMRAMLGNGISQNLLESPQINDALKKEEATMYVLSSKAQYRGASMVTRSELMKQIGDLFAGNFYVIPSSLDEVILIPCRCAIPAEVLASMVREINRTEVPPEMVLSDRVFCYDRMSGRIVDALEDEKERENKSGNYPEKTEKRSKRESYER